MKVKTHAKEVSENDQERFLFKKIRLLKMKDNRLYSIDPSLVDHEDVEALF